MKRLITLPLLLLLACTKIYDGASSSPTAPTQPANAVDKIEFRVFGSSLLSNVVSIRHTDSINGITIYNGGVPYLASTQSKEDSIFVFVEAQSNGSLFGSSLLAQIFVNGVLFREASAQGFTLNVQTSGTYRRK